MPLDSLLQQSSQNKLKFIFVGGKGGVGKTTTSSALASLVARHGRVLLISTDPAHSLGDAWRTSFSNVPTRIEALDDAANGGSLDVMEVDPQQSLQAELAEWAEMSHELFDGKINNDGDNNNNNANSGDKTDSNSDDQSNEWMSRIRQFQEWLSGIPGIDEATALSNAITHIESGRYDLIVFDTAPTGHTLKLLALPEILEQGIDKLQSWQTTFWGYWQAFKAASSGGGLSKAHRRANLQQVVTDKLIKYKHGIQKVAMMLQDQQRTRFVAVCLAELLSVSETQRLLRKLQRHKVVASHVVVNQLVVQDALTTRQLTDLEALAEIGDLALPTELLRKTVHACRLTTARKSIQQKYLSELKAYPETDKVEICEVPLLAEEVTGAEAIQRFARLLLADEKEEASSTAAAGTIAPNGGGKLYDDLIAAKNESDKETSASDVTFAPGDVVQITGLHKSTHYNGLEGKVTTHQNRDTGRHGVSLDFKGESKTLALQPANMLLIRKSDKKQKGNDNGRADKSMEETGNNTVRHDDPASSSGIMDKAKSLLNDPEIKQLIDSNPRFLAAVQDCLANPMNVMQYLGDPELSPLISKALAKM